MPQFSRIITPAFVSVTSLFFAWGFVTATIDPLIPSVRSIFTLSYTESMLTQFAFFLAYGVVSLPSAALLARLGAARSIIIALLLMLCGCLVMPLATALRVYPLVLVALFIIASGITLLQVAANPLAAALGEPKHAHWRLILSQAFNSMGTVLAPVAGATLMLRGGVFATGGDAEAAQAESLHNIDLSFLLIALVIAGLALGLWRGQRRIGLLVPEEASPLAAFRSAWAIVGAAAIFLYVGAEVSIGSMMINFLAQKSVLGISAEEAGHMLSFYWLGAMVGRFGGTALLAQVKVGSLLTGAATGAGLLCLTVTLSQGHVAAAAAIAIGLCNSVMFPTIFTLTLERSTAPRSATSGLLCMAIVGGAILPLLAGAVADRVGLARAFLVPMAAYAGIAVFAVSASRQARSLRRLVDD